MVKKEGNPGARRQQKHGSLEGQGVFGEWYVIDCEWKCKIHGLDLGIIKSQKEVRSIMKGLGKSCSEVELYFCSHWNNQQRCLQGKVL